MTQKSSDQLLESVSALVDGESSELETRQVLKSLDQNDNALDCWQRYHTIGAIMRKERCSSRSSENSDFLASVKAEIEAETGASSGEASHREKVSATSGAVVTKPSGWQGMFGQTMIAASVAASFVVGISLVGSRNGVDQPGPMIVAGDNEAKVESSVSSVPLGFELPKPESQVVSSSLNNMHTKGVSSSIPQTVQTVRGLDHLSDAATQELLNQLLIEHAERSSVNGSLGLMPFAKVSEMGQEESSH